MIKVELEGMSFSWETEEEFEQVKECLEILKTFGIEVERIKAANERLKAEHRKQMQKEMRGEMR